MMSVSHRIVVAGLLIGGLTLAAVGLRFGNRESSAMGVDGHIDSALSSAARPVTPDAPVDDPQNAGIARVLQAVHDSLQRGDLASARVLLDAVLTMRKDEPQALLLQKELAAREVKATAFEPSRIAKPRAHAHASARTATPHHAAEATDDDELATAAPPSAEFRADIASDAAAAGDNASVMAAHASDAQPEHVAAPAPQTASASASATGEPADTPVSPALPATTQNNDAPAPPPATATGDTPKTRAQVRDELRAARSDGAMSRFGNPDPYGPGGAASRSTQPSPGN